MMEVLTSPTQNQTWGFVVMECAQGSDPADLVFAGVPMDANRGFFPLILEKGVPRSDFLPSLVDPSMVVLAVIVELREEWSCKQWIG